MSISYSYTDIETNENLTLYVTFNEALDLMAAMEYVQTTLEDGLLLRYGEVVNPQTILKPLTCTLSGDVLEYIKSPITINTSDAMYLFLKVTKNEDTNEIISSWLKRFGYYYYLCNSIIQKHVWSLFTDPGLRIRYISTNLNIVVLQTFGSIEIDFVSFSY